MQDKMLIRLIFCATVLFCSCTKNDGPQGTLGPPVDTLGAGWQRIKVDTTIAFRDVFFLNTLSGFVSGTGYIGKTSDGGLSWTNVLPDSLKDDFYRLYFSDAQHGWAAGNASLIRTKDGGATWERLLKSETFDLSFPDGNNGYVTTQYGSFYKTTNGGSSFTTINPGGTTGSVGARAVCFLNAQYGWFQYGGSVYRTRDAGASFETVSFNTLPAGQYVLSFIDSSKGWSAGFSGLYGTTDGGKTFKTLSGSQSIGTDVSFFDASNGFVLSNGNLCSTTDGGATLNILSRVHKTNLVQLYFTDPAHGWAVGSPGFMYRYVKP